MGSLSYAPHAAAVAIAITCLTSAPTAAAFCRTTTEGLAAGCIPEDDNCCTLGKPVFWESQCIGYRINQRGSKKLGVTPEQLSEIAARAFAKWTQPNASCTPGLTAVELASVAGDRSGDGLNVIAFRDDEWPYRGGDDVAALTTVMFETTTGRVREADIELNAATQDLSLEAAPGKLDIESVLMHDVGHFLGLGHSNVPTALMRPGYESIGTANANVLDADDQKAVCDVYPSRRTRNAAAGQVPSTACNFAALPPGATCDDPTVTHGCGVSAAPRDSKPWPALALAALFAITRRRRRLS